MKTIPEIDRRSLADQIFAHIKHLILTGELAAGERIPEARIGSQFGVSRTPMREAIHRLAQYGLVVIKPRSYAEVAGMGRWEVEQVAQVRASIEELTARLLAQCASESDLTALESLATACESRASQRDLAATFEIDSEFHREIAERCANLYAADILQRLDARIQLARLVQCASAEHVQNAVQQHRALLDAFRAHDPDRAGSLMRAHVYSMAPEAPR